jgi:hypothetical protein
MMWLGVVQGGVEWGALRWGRTWSAARFMAEEADGPSDPLRHPIFKPSRVCIIRGSSCRVVTDADALHWQWLRWESVYWAQSKEFARVASLSAVRAGAWLRRAASHQDEIVAAGAGGIDTPVRLAHLRNRRSAVALLVLQLA